MGIGVFGCIKNSIACRFEMKIAIICFAIFVCAVCASEEGDNAAITRHEGHDGLQGGGYVAYGNSQEPVYRPPQPQPQPRPYYGPQPQRTGLLQNPLMLIILLGLLNPSTTTAETTTMAATTTAAPDPCAGLTKVGDCCYLLPDTTATWDAAQNECAGAINGGRLAVEGFNQALAGRQNIVNQLNANGVTFWIGAKGEVNGAGVDTTSFTAPLAAVDPITGDATFISELYDPGSSLSDNDPLCGRVDAADGNTLVFESCAPAARRYMCEVCPA